MQKKTYLLALFSVTMLMSSCNDALEADGLYPNSGESLVENTSTRALTVDSLETGNAIQLEETEELKALKEKLEDKKEQRAGVLGYNDYDEYFYSNIYAIREMPLEIYARGVVGNTSNRYFSCEAANKEVVLANFPSTNQQRFYLKVLPATSGIPYLIYSQVSNTPLVVGYYNSNPNNKILFAKPDNSGDLFSASWDLVPSQTKGYFAIESQSYLGQSDPNNMWSVFNYVLEVKNDNKIGYGQYSGKTHQEFQIIPVNTFELRDIQFIEGSGTFTQAADIQIKSTTTNTSVEPKPYTIPVSKSYFETSYFYENQSSIKINKTNKKIQRPRLVANQVVLPNDNSPKDADYISSSVQKIPFLLKFDIQGDAPENCLIQVTSHITTYNVSINYIAKAYVGTREVQFSGTWRGYVISDPKLKKPIHITRYFDLDTGDEIISYSSRKNGTN